LGTALTPDQARLVSRFARKVVVNYDGDNAGIQAAKKAIAILLAEDLEVKILVLPEASDPDEFIRKSGVSEYQKQRGLAQPHIQFVIDQAIRDRKLSNPADKEAAIDEVLPYIRAVRSRLQKREYFDIAMDSLRISDVTLRRELWHSIRQGTGEGGRTGETAKTTIKRTAAKPTVAEIQLLELLVTDETVQRNILPKLETADYQDLPTASIFKAIIDIKNEGAEIDFGRLSSQIDETDPAAELLPMLLMSEASADGEDREVRPNALKCLDALRLMNINSRIRELYAEIADAERAGDEAKLVRLSVEYGELNKLRKSFEPQSQIAQAENA
jgi:DNA primase